MVHQRDKLAHTPQWCVKRNLVQILDHYIVVVRRESICVIPASEEWVRLTITDPVNVDTIQIHARGSIFPGAAEKIDTVSALDDAAENLLEVKLGAAGLRILVILPVEYEYPH
jgi:hypothetical protein